VDKGKEIRISSLEYQIRKTERGIKVLFAQKGNEGEILRYGDKREKLKDELEQLTRTTYFSSGRWKVLQEGRREPKIPEWPL
jgi:hypothetical protein